MRPNVCMQRTISVAFLFTGTDRPAFGETGSNEDDFTEHRNAFQIKRGGSEGNIEKH